MYHNYGRVCSNDFCVCRWLVYHPVRRAKRNCLHRTNCWRIQYWSFDGMLLSYERQSIRIRTRRREIQKSKQEFVTNAIITVRRNVCVFIRCRLLISISFERPRTFLASPIRERLVDFRTNSSRASPENGIFIHQFYDASSLRTSPQYWAHGPMERHTGQDSEIFFDGIKETIKNCQLRFNEDDDDDDTCRWRIMFEFGSWKLVIVCASSPYPLTYALDHILCTDCRCRFNPL